MTILMNDRFISRIISLTNSNPVLKVQCKISSKNTRNKIISQKYCRTISSQNNRYPYSQLNNWIMGQGTTVNLHNLPRLSKAGNNKLENIRCVGDHEDCPSPPYNISTALYTSVTVSRHTIYISCQ